MKHNDLLYAPITQWKEIADSPITTAIQDAERQAAHLATTYARMSAYFSRRMAGGKHADAVKAQNIAARKVRQALGYTYADDKITF